MKGEPHHLGLLDTAMLGGSMQSVSAMSGAAMEGVTRLCSHYAANGTAVAEELARFANERMQRDIELGQAVAECRDLGAIMRLQQEWMRQAMEDYAAGTQRLAELGTAVLAEGMKPVQDLMQDSLDAGGGMADVGAPAGVGEAGTKVPGTKAPGTKGPGTKTAKSA